MNQLKNMIVSGETLADGLKQNAVLHKYYKLYTSIDIALAFLLDGYILLSNGCQWNDCSDRNQMKNKQVYGKCFSWSTRENVAMWMLYSDNRGTNGAALNFPKSVFKSIQNVETIDIVEVKNGELISVAKERLRKGEQDFQLFLTDVIYSEPIKEDKHGIERESVTYNEEHVCVPKAILEHEDVFRKQYEWRYENECRLIVRPSSRALEKITALEKAIEERSPKENKGYVTLRLQVPKYRTMNERNIIHSPVYKGNVLYGVQSKLHGSVEWEL